MFQILIFNIELHLIAEKLSLALRPNIKKEAVGVQGSVRNLQSIFKAD